MLPRENFSNFANVMFWGEFRHLEWVRYVKKIKGPQGKNTLGPEVGG